MLFSGGVHVVLSSLWTKPAHAKSKILQICCQCLQKLKCCLSISSFPLFLLSTAERCPSSSVYDGYLLNVFFHATACLFISLNSHVCQSHLWTDGKGVPLQVHLHICSCPEQIPLCQSDGWDRLWPTSKGASMAPDWGEPEEPLWMTLHGHSQVKI